MTGPHQLNIAVHVAAGTMALGIGLIPVVTRKGGPIHRRVGWWFVATGAVVVGCADLGCLVFAQPGPLVVAALAATYQYAGGLRSMRRFSSAPGTVDAALALATLLICGVLATRMGAGNGSWTPAVGWPVLGWIAAIALYDLSRHWWADTWRRRVRPIDHGLKMTGVYLAMLGAGLGNLLPEWKPWSSLGPAWISPLVDGTLIALYVRSQRRKVRSGPESYPGTLVAT